MLPSTLAVSKFADVADIRSYYRAPAALYQRDDRVTGGRIGLYAERMFAGRAAALGAGSQGYKLSSIMRTI